MSREDRNGHSWFIWNLANIISLTRLLTPINFFVIDLFWSWWDIKLKLIVFLLISLTDCIDGWLAKHIKNTEGIGKLIDPVADKVHQLSVLVFILTGVLLEKWIGILVMAGEIPLVFISIYGIYTIVKKEIRKNKIITEAYKEYRAEAKKKKIEGEKAVEELGEFWYAIKNFPSKIYLGVKDKIIKEIKVSPWGKMKMVAYFIAVAFLVSYTVYPMKPFWWGYVVMFSAGFLLCLASYPEYYQKFNDWQKTYSCSCS